MSIRLPQEDIENLSHQIGATPSHVQTRFLEDFVRNVIQKVLEQAQWQTAAIPDASEAIRTGSLCSIVGDSGLSLRLLSRKTQVGFTDSLEVRRIFEWINENKEELCNMQQ